MEKWIEEEKERRLKDKKASDPLKTQKPVRKIEP